VDFRDTPEEAAFRQRLKTWLADNIPQGEPDSDEGRNQFEQEWHRTLYRAGWLGLSWPRSVGGQELSPIYEAILNDELGEAGAPPAPGGFLGRAILHFGTPEQQAAYIPGILSGEVQWCQGFSEPSSGSDLASLRTRAERVPGGYAITGQKLWTSRAHWSQWCLLLARTDPTAKRHRGISCFVIETSTPGVSPRSITQITGDRRFAEVFFDGAFVPESQRIGPENGGWQLALTTLAFERGPADIGQVGRLRRRLRELDALLAKSPEDAEARAKVERCHLMVEVLRLQVLSSLSKRLTSDRPSSEGSLDKLLMAQTDQLLAHTKMDLLGSSPLLGEQPADLYEYFWSRAATIYGGTAQIQRNIVAERVLGLPPARRPN
jgi:alkylation response protein AidB-like acyl-CoA dehydrogenase